MAEYPISDSEIRWLVEQSMLAQASRYARRYSGQGLQWRRSYAQSNPRRATDKASVWFTAYPAAVVTHDGDSVLRTLADPALWQAFQEIGIQALHTGPMKRAGGLSGTTYTPTIDGHFDRIGFEIDPVFGSTEEYRTLAATAAEAGGVIIDDIVPGHTGKGADFRLAEKAYGDYPGLYHMVEIDEVHWPLLPSVELPGDAANLSPQQVDTLHDLGYIVGRLSRVIFYEPGVKLTNWSATNVIMGHDGKPRRWVYLHYFKEGQPSLNWLDPTFAAQRMIIGDALHSLDELGAGILRLDANGFLGVEATDDGPAWSEGHPLSVTANQLIAGMVRKAGGFTFQELNLSVDDIAAISYNGADLSYDFITRPAYYHALVARDTEFLRLMLRTLHDYNIDPASLIHALQNHDELTLELVHFWTLHKNDTYRYKGRAWTGGELREHIRDVMYAALTGDDAPYNRRFVTNGIACTTVSMIAAALGIRDVWHMSANEKHVVQRVHLLLAQYNALQPGVFALSGWDLVGALPLHPEQVADLIRDGDTRWIHRGAYDLMGMTQAATSSESAMPQAESLYGSIPDQLHQSDSFVNQLRSVLTQRAELRLRAARQVAIPDVQNEALLLMVHELPDLLGTQVTALNFGAETVNETLALTGLDVSSQQSELSIQLEAFEGKSLLLA